jgi:hypothetical protein
MEREHICHDMRILPNLLHYHNSLYIQLADDANGLSANRCTKDVVSLIMAETKDRDKSPVSEQCMSFVAMKVL